MKQMVSLRGLDQWLLVSWQSVPLLTFPSFPLLFRIKLSPSSAESLIYFPLCKVAMKAAFNGLPAEASFLLFFLLQMKSLIREGSFAEIQQIPCIGIHWQGKSLFLLPSHSCIHGSLVPLVQPLPLENASCAPSHILYHDVH